MLAGIIAQLLPARRLGFVQPTNGGIPILFQAISVEGVPFADLCERQAVTYTLERDPKGRGPRAIRIRPIDCPPPPEAVPAL